ncbi:acyl--CoA ligase family protein [Nocardioides sp. YIM 152315]|uniref:acyl--CoA ligase family protein n=1 Tax=Nocardioides sp. YIM 152315 TaxID=3031760 RepID=UPI0023DC9995|nr:acyl--CoA ligase family protein [Nocardioides sp. YIM 152315]MDF1605099.1 acyl--CoA ligase family protein [Nocardioides sp. YIM 152315]
MSAFTFAPLTPASFLDRSAAVFAERLAVVDGDLRLTYAELADRCARLVSALAAAGVEPGDRVAALCANSHVMLELHHGVPARGAVLVSVNIRLSHDEMRYVVEHSGARLLVATRELAEQARALADGLGIDLVVEEEYDAWLDAAPADPVDRADVDERDLIALNYTSGTTGRPKGVMYHHRGAYLQAVAMAYHARLGPGARYLWTLPMFHCNGWCFTWAVTAAGGTHLCLRAVEAGEIWRLLREEGVTHFSGAPTVLAMIATDPAADSAAGPLAQRVHVDVGGAPPSPALIGRLGPLGLDVTHLYGLTETFGPIAINEWQPEWDDLDTDERDRLRARQGIGNIVARPLRVLDADGHDVPADGETIGELAARGNDVMLGYYRDDEATAAVTRSGCFLTGDLAVRHPDGYVEIRDRRKDVIISGGENVASVEVERALDEHPAVLECAVVGAPDEKWGEVPVAFVTLREGADVDVDELRAFLRERIAGFKVPRRIELVELPKTSTGKIQKNVLRRRLRVDAREDTGDRHRRT